MPLPWLQEALDEDTVKITRAMLTDIFDHYQGMSKGSPKVEVYNTIAQRLSEMVGRGEPWGWRYVASVLAKTNPVRPSRDFARGVEKLAAVIDDLPVIVAITEPVQVYGMPGMIRAGSVVYGQSVRCGGCGVWFVPDNPFRRKCKTCSPPRQRKH